jgi:cytochrome c
MGRGLIRVASKSAKRYVNSAFCGAERVMDGFEVNKILGAILATCMFTLGLSIIAGGIFAPKMPAKPGYEIAVTEEPGPAAGPTKAEPEQPFPKLLAEADVKKGANLAKKCVVCHSFEKGGPNKVGPNLWGIVGRPRASHPGFGYSTAMQTNHDPWTIDELNKYLTNPRADVPGTAMAFLGIPKGNERADVIAYLNTLSDNPQPLPKP